MPYEQESNKKLSYPMDAVFQAAKYCVTYMGGKILKEDQKIGLLHAQMDKKLFGDYLGDRSKLEISFTNEEANETIIYIIAFPLTAVGQKLLFGARKGAVETMVSAFYEQVEKRLQD